MNIVSLSAEVIHHHTFTDYLNDVSTSYPSLDVYNQMTHLLKHYQKEI